MKMASEYLQSYHVDPFARCPPYLIGILLGWILHKTKNSNVYLNKVNFSNKNLKNPKNSDEKKSKIHEKGKNPENFI